MSAWVYLAMKKAGVLSGAEMEVMETKKTLMITVQSDGNKWNEDHREKILNFFLRHFFFILVAFLIVRYNKSKIVRRGLNIKKYTNKSFPAPMFYAAPAREINIQKLSS